MTVFTLPSRTRARVVTHRHTRPIPSVGLSRMTRYRGGTYSHTVDNIVFTDGTSARTDLIRLNPNLQAYSLDFTGIAPTRPARYRLDAWSALPHLRERACEAEVDWIVRHSFPMLTTTELSQQLRAAGHPLGRANISEHEAIAGTQAAIWYLTNGLALDNRPLNVPVAVHRDTGPRITFEFDGEPQLGGYAVKVTSDTAVTFTLQKSANGAVWQDISVSRLPVAAGNGWYRRTLGLGSTLSASSFGRAGRGHRFYRLIATSERGTSIVDDVRFWLTGSPHYRNAERIVHLYNYLLDGARQAGNNTVRPCVLDADAVIESGLVGPFRVAMPVTLTAPEGHALMDADGFTLDGVIEPDTDFYLRPPSGARAATLIATVPDMPHGFGGRVLAAVARDEATQRLTPVALSVRADVAIHVDISWDAEEALADIVGEDR
jgi:TQXA domain-containing protein